MLKQQGLPATPLDIETRRHMLYQEIKYQGQCYGEPCFILDSIDAIIGKCEATGAYIMVDLAVRQRLCDHQQTRYAPQHKENKTHSLKIKEKQILRCPVKLDVRMHTNNPMKTAKKSSKNRV